MQVETERFGPLQVPEDRVLTFADGLPGFADARQFTLVDGRDEGVLYWLQSMEDPALAFLCAVPWVFFPDYAPELSDDDQEALGLEKADDAMVLSILSVHREQQSITANLLGPIVVNQLTRQGRQVVLTGDDYPVQAQLSA